MTREEAIKNLEMIRIAFVEPVTKEQGKLIDDTIDMAISALKENKGEWIPMYDRWGDIVTTVCGYECSKCCEWNADNDNFCPNCGADMRG